MKWTKEKCQEEALKYNYRNEFKNKNSGAYRASIKNNWIEDISKHMLNPHEKNIIWTKEKCQEEALKYVYRNDFKLNSNTCYNKAIKLNCLSIITSHMQSSHIFNDITKEQCQEEALKYTYLIDFIKNNSTAYYSAIKYKYIDDICSHMIRKKKPNNYWNKERCLEEAIKYNKITHFSKKVQRCI